MKTFVDYLENDCMCDTCVRVDFDIVAKGFSFLVPAEIAADTELLEAFLLDYFDDYAANAAVDYEVTALIDRSK